MLDNILLILVLLILCAKLIGSLFERIGLDSTIGELLTGIAFGPSVLNLVSTESIESFAIIGSVLILFVAGLKQRDILEITKDKPAVALGIRMLFLTAVPMALFFYAVPPLFHVQFTLLQAVVLGLAFAIIDVGVPAKVLIGKGLISTPVGKVTIRAAIVNIMLGLLLFTIPTLFMGANLLTLEIKAIGMALFLGITVLLVLFLSKVSRFVMKVHIEEAEFSLAIILVLALSYLTELIGFSSILGAFIAGAIVARMPFAETRSFSAKVTSISFGLFVPLFFVWFGLSIHLAEIWKSLGLALLIFVAYSGLRFAIAYGYLKKKGYGMPALIASSMLSVDVESLVILMVAMTLGIFSTAMPLTLFAPSVLLSTLLIVVLVAAFSRTPQKINKAAALRKARA
ncbi:MAG: cation:proton antiporter [Nanoarchaeota archaeon]